MKVKSTPSFGLGWEFDNILQASTSVSTSDSFCLCDWLHVCHILLICENFGDGDNFQVCVRIFGEDNFLVCGDSCPVDESTVSDSKD